LAAFWNEEEIDRAVKANDRQTLGLAFLALSRWIIAKDVRSPAWMDRADLVQTAVVCCFKALDSRNPDRPRMPYFAQVVKFELRHVVRRSCYPHHTGTDLMEFPELEARPPADRHDLQADILRTDAARTFPSIASAFLEQFHTGHITTAGEFKASSFGQVYRPQVKQFLELLKEDLYSNSM